MDIFVAPHGARIDVMPDGGASRRCTRPEAAALAGEIEAEAAGAAPVRWIWPDTARVYPDLIRAAAGPAAGVRRCHDLRLVARILQHAAAYPVPDWAQADPPEPSGWAPELTLLDDLEVDSGPTLAQVQAEHARQRAAIAASADPGRLRFLAAVESAGALIAVEMHEAGLPWDRQIHGQLLEQTLGPRPASGSRPRVMAELVAQLRELLGAPGLNPDSQPDLLRHLHAAGIPVASTSKWDLRQVEHPAIGPLLEYKRLSRLLSANGWAWMDTWVEPGSGSRPGRFHPDYVPGGVVTGRWATRGGGAMQIPKAVRAAVVADPGWRLVVADAAQIEPRVLAAMSHDEALAAAGRDQDLYAGLAAAGIAADRPGAKVAMLGALYGATTGEAGLLMPGLMRAYPRATALVEAAARTGERGGSVRTWLGRTSPPPGEAWQQAQSAAARVGATDAEQRRSRAQARDWGRFTRNFVVQGSAAEWALAWMAQTRLALRATGAALVYFLHDEIIVHAPADAAGGVAQIVQDCAQEAGRLLFGDFPVTFPLDVAVVAAYDEAR